MPTAKNTSSGILESRLWRVLSHRGMVMSMASGILFICLYISYWFLNSLLPETEIDAYLMLSVGALGFHPLQQNLTQFLHRLITTRIYNLRVYNHKSPRNQNQLNLKKGLLTGKLLGGYKLQNIIDKGGMGEVYIAEAGGLLLAVKVIDLTQSPDYRMRFIREIEALQLAKHPNVVQIFDSGFDGDYAFMVMEYVDGLSLKDFMKTNAPVALSDIVDIVEGIAAAVDHMHTQGIIHRDLKPSNIILYQGVNNRYVPVMLDFGVAKQSAATVITLEGTVGTVEYMSPEQILEAPMVDSTSDVYSVGVMVFEMLTGKLPYDGSIGAIVYGHLHETIPDPHLYIPGIPDVVVEAIQTAMAKEPGSRFRTVVDFADKLAEGLMNVDDSPSPHGLKTSSFFLSDLSD